MEITTDEIALWRNSKTENALSDLCQFVSRALPSIVVTSCFFGKDESLGTVCKG